MRDIIERFRYRFQLWHREQREDLVGVPRSDSRTIREYAAEQRSPRMSRRGLFFVSLLWLTVPAAYVIYMGLNWQSRGYITGKTVTLGLFLLAPAVFGLCAALTEKRPVKHEERDDEII